MTGALEASASPALHQPFLFSSEKTFNFTCVSATFSFPRTTLPHFGEDSGFSPVPPAGWHAASPGEEQIYFFPCFATSWVAECFSAVHNYRNDSEKLYIYLCFIIPRIFLFFSVSSNWLKIYLGVLYVILKLNSQFLQ